MTAMPTNPLLLLAEMSFLMEKTARLLKTGFVADKAVLVTLAWFHNDKTGQCNPSISTISLHCDLAMRSVSRSLRRLEKAGTISVKTTGRSHQFLLNFQPLSEDETAATPDSLSGQTCQPVISDLTQSHLRPDSLSGQTCQPVISDLTQSHLRPDRLSGQTCQPVIQSTRELQENSHHLQGQPGEDDEDEKTLRHVVQAAVSEKKEKRRDIEWNADSVEAWRAINEALGRPPGRPFSDEELHALGIWTAAHGNVVRSADMDDLRWFLIECQPRYDSLIRAAHEAIPEHSPLRRRRRAAGRVIAQMQDHIDLARQFRELLSAQKNKNRGLSPPPGDCHALARALLGWDVSPSLLWEQWQPDAQRELLRAVSAQPTPNAPAH